MLRAPRLGPRACSKAISQFRRIGSGNDTAKAVGVQREPLIRKTVPEQGGNVLMQDGKSFKKMTADEFKNAPQAESHSS